MYKKMKKLSFLFLPLMFLFSLPFMNKVYAANTWQLDTTFDADGFLSMDLSAGEDDHLYDLAVQADGKIVVAGYIIKAGDADWVVARLNSDGTLDPTFGTNGIVSYDYMNEDESASAVDIQTDGKIVVTGEGDNGVDYDLIALRLNTDGTFDNTFGTAGVVTWDSGDEGASDIVFGANSSIYLFGNTDYLTAVWKYTTAGVLDASYGTAGVFTSPRAAVQEYGVEGHLSLDGKLYVIGIDRGVPTDGMLLWRISSDGTADNTFSIDGFDVMTLPDQSLEGLRVEVLADGTVIALGSDYPTVPNLKEDLPRKSIMEESNYNPSVIFTINTSVFKYSTDGVVDSSFADMGDSI